jgi:hypothetical protein
MEQEDPGFITDGKEFFVSFNTPLVRGYLPVPIPKADPVLRWNGPKIDLVRSWYPALRFMKDHVNHEVVLRLFMTHDRSNILIFPLSQIYGTGMSVKEEITKEEREWWASEGLIEAGTVHSHCTAAAFASGTDKHDEKHRDGLHLTVGKLNSGELDLHSRMVWTVPGEEDANGKLIRASTVTIQKPNLMDWFTFPQHIEMFISMEPELEESVVKYVLCKPPDPRAVYPKEWKDKLLRPAAITPPSLGAGGKWARGADGQMHMYDPEIVNYPSSGNLSKIDDLPGHGFKKKESGEQREPDTQNGRISAKAALLWDLWSEVMALVSMDPVLRERQVRVSDFAPDRRGALFIQYPEAQETWEQIQRMLKANNATDQEFFESWEKTSWPINSDEYY